MQQSGISLFVPGFTFVKDMVSYVQHFHDHLEPKPLILIGASSFTNNIGQLLLLLIRSQDNDLQREIQDIVAGFRSVPKDKLEQALAEKVCQGFLRRYLDQLSKSKPKACYEFFVVVCRFCLEFSRAQIVEGKDAVIYFTQGFLLCLLNDSKAYQVLDRFAQEKLRDFDGRLKRHWWSGEPL